MGDEWERAQALYDEREIEGRRAGDVIVCDDPVRSPTADAAAEISEQKARRNREHERRERRVTHPPLAETWETQVVGVTNYDYPDKLNEMRAVFEQPFEQRGTMWVIFKRNPHNPHDANAVQVWWRNRQIGYLNSVIASRLHEELRCNTRWGARVLVVAGPEDQPGVTIRAKRLGPIRTTPVYHNIGSHR